MNCGILLVILATVMSLDMAHEHEKNFYYVVGQNATIQCPQHGGPYKFITLMFSSLDNPSQKVYTVDFRSTSQNEHPTKNYKSRVQFRTKHNMKYFILLNLIAEDEGSFECKIIPKGGTSVIFKSTLYIIVPATSVVVTDATGKEAAGLAGPYNENEFIELTCEAFGGKPTPNITWYRNGNAITSSKNLRKEKAKSMLKIGPLRRNHTRVSYHCEASNHRNAIVRSKALNLDINTLPTVLKFVGDEEPLISDRPYEIECLVEGSKPPAKITWWLNDKPLSNHYEYAIDENKSVKVSTLTFTPKVADEGKKLKCFAKNPSISHKPIVVFRTLSIHYIPNVTLSFYPKSTVDEGDPVRLDCKIKSNPEPFEVSFFKGHIKLYDINNYMKISNRSVSIVKTTRKSSGSYTCVARNEVGIGSANPASLRINHAPKCKSRFNLVGASRHETINVKCAVDSWPAVTHFHWHFNRSGEITYINRNYTSDEFTSIIKYTPKNENDFGSLLCWAKNSYGKMKEPCEFSIVKAELPDRLENCTQLNRSSESIMVACISGKDGGLRQKFIAELLDTSQEMHVINTSSLEPEFYMEDLSPGTTYFLTIYSQNSKGYSEKVLLQVNTSYIADRPGLAMPSFHSFPLTPILSVLIGVVGVLILVALITAGIMHLRGGDESKKHKNIQGKHSPRKAVDVDKNRSDQSGMPNKLKSANLYEVASHDQQKGQKGQQA